MVVLVITYTNHDTMAQDVKVVQEFETARSAQKENNFCKFKDMLRKTFAIFN